MYLNKVSTKYFILVASLIIHIKELFNKLHFRYKHQRPPPVAMDLALVEIMSMINLLLIKSNNNNNKVRRYNVLQICQFNNSIGHGNSVCYWCGI